LYLSKDNRQKVRERLRQLEDIVGYAEQRLDKPNNFLMVIAYILRKIAKSDEGYDKEVLKKLVSRKDGVSDPTREIPLYDYYFMMKNFRVGVG